MRILARKVEVAVMTGMIMAPAILMATLAAPTILMMAMTIGIRGGQMAAAEVAEVPAPILQR